MKRAIESAAIIGAGALGLLYALPLHNKLKEKFTLLADGFRFEKLNNTRFRINGIPSDLPVISPDELKNKPDILIIAVKNHHLDDILPLLKASVSDQTILISVLNGIDSEEFLKNHFPKAQILYTVALGMDAVKLGDELHFTNPGKLFLGRENNDRKDPILKLTADFLNSASITTEIPEDIHRALWWKWMINIGVNQVSAVTGVPYRVFQESGEPRKLMDSAMHETVAVAQAAGIHLSEKDIHAWYKVLNTLGPEGKTSMLQDMEARRVSEAPWFSGKLIQLGEKYGVPVPVNETLYRIIRTKESLFPK